jgi:hypothetical protein
VESVWPSIESSYNRSVKVMFDLPYATHRSLIEPLTESSHVKHILIKRFLGFLVKIRKSPKKALNMLLSKTMKDARSVTGRNLRNIMLPVGKSKVEDVCFQDHAKLSYFTLDRENMWRIPMIQEIVNLKQGDLEVEDFDSDELNEMLDHLCTS